MPNEYQPPMAVLRQQKVKTLGQLAARSKHNTRTAKAGLEHTDAAKGGADVFLGSEDALEAWHARMAAVGLSKDSLRKNAVPAVEWIASVSPEWFQVATFEMIQEWAETTIAFVAEKMGGKENILQAVLHTDESTPHLQFLTIPLTHKEVAARGRGSKDKPKRKVWSLSATDAVGGHRSVLEGFQTDYAARLSPLGIHRGIPRKETGARNLNPSTWRATQARILDEAVEHRSKAKRLYAKAEAAYAEAHRVWTEAKAAAALLIGGAKTERLAEIAKSKARTVAVKPTFSPAPPPPQPAPTPPPQPVEEAPQPRRKRKPPRDEIR